MVSLFKKTSTKAPSEVVRVLREALLDKALAPKKATEEISRGITAMRALMHSDGSGSASEASQDQLVMLSNEIYSTELLPLLIQNLARFDFEV
jgi:calcium binding protein 39